MAAGSIRNLWREFVSQPRTTLRKFADWQAREAVVTAALHADKHKKDGLRGFEADYRSFLALSENAGRSLSINPQDFWPCIDDRSPQTTFDRHYLYHPAWAARILARTRPEKHVDVSSILDFCAIVSAFIPVDFYDFRPARIDLSNLNTGATDLSQLQFSDASIVSLSCLHVIEHVGLGRYGDTLDPNGDMTAIRELTRVLAPGGNLLVAVPVGRPRIQFNAHRIYDFAVFRDYFAPLELVEFALIPDDEVPDGLIYDPPSELVNAQAYGCGCYWFRKSGVT